MLVGNEPQAAVQILHEEAPQRSDVRIAFQHGVNTGQFDFDATRTPIDWALSRVRKR